MKSRFLALLSWAVLAIVVIIAIKSNNYLKTRIYFGDRITGTFVIQVVGKEYQPVEKYFEYESSEKAKLPIDGLPYFFIKGGKYGPYIIEFSLNNEALYWLTGDDSFLSYETNSTLVFRYFNANWWHITELILSAEIVMQDGEWIVHTKVFCRESNESGGYSDHPPNEKSFKYSDITSDDNILRFGI